MSFWDKYNETYYTKTEKPREEILETLQQRIEQAKMNIGFRSVFNKIEYERVKISEESIIIPYSSLRWNDAGVIIVDVTMDEQGMTLLIAKTKLDTDSITPMLVGALLGLIAAILFLNLYISASPLFIAIFSVIYISLFSVLSYLSVKMGYRHLKQYLENIYSDIGISVALLDSSDPA